jgi:3-deoxy-D-manno-octulosonic-acid transferase
METQQTLDALPLTQDGGNSSDMRTTSSKMRKVRSSMSKELLMLKTETSLFMLLMVESTKCGMLSMLMNGRVSQRRVNSMKISDFTSREIS